MKPLFSKIEFDLAKPNDLLLCKCYYCNNFYYKTKHFIQISMLPNTRHKNMFCSKKCQSKMQITKINICCKNCNNEFKITKFEYEKSNNHFCSRSCAATYNNKHKTTGVRRSKLEKYLEIELIKLYPDLEILFNDKNIINSELDIYIPSLKLAFELNGIFHYEPIYGENKLNQIQNNDNRKFQACIEKGIELCIIDTSQQKYFKEQTAKKYLDVIINIINDIFCTPNRN